MSVLNMEFVNEAWLDRLLRVLIGGAMLILGWSGFGSEYWEAACKIFGWFPLVTGLVGWCPLYAILGAGTRRVRRRTR